MRTGGLKRGQCENWGFKERAMCELGVQREGNVRTGGLKRGQCENWGFKERAM